MGTGKSSVGRQVAGQLKFDFVDTDDLIEAQAGITITDIFAQKGEVGFRALESEVLAGLADRRDTVISTGGGVGANEQHLANLKSHALVVCLWASPEVIWRRVRHQDHRPLLQEADPQAKIRSLLAERESTYQQADVLIHSDLRSVREVAGQVIHHFHVARQSVETS